MGGISEPLLQAFTSWCGIPVSLCSVQVNELEIVMSVEVAPTAVLEVDPKAAVRENEKKWGKTLMDAGWTCIPSTIILRQQALGLDPVDMNIVLVIAAHWWKADQLAFPSKKLIADTIGKDPTTVRRRLARLEKDGLIKRILRPQPGGRHNSNEYRLSGLITGAEPLAKQELAKREEGRIYRKARASKKGTLAVVGKP